MDRLIEIDVIKGIADITMIIFHYYYLSTVMNIKEFNIDSGILSFLASFSHYTFILFSGINMGISTMNKKKEEFQKQKIKRGLFLLIIGFIISFLTKLEFGESYVKFGIMHFMGTATILSSFYANLPSISIIISIIILLIKLLLNIPDIKNKFYNICTKNPFSCFILGIFNVKYKAIDHFSIIPFLGIFSLGIGLAYILYSKEKKKEEEETAVLKRNYSFLNVFDKLKDNIIIKKLSWLGKNTLWVYIIHFLVLWLFFKLQQKNNSL